MNNGPASRLLPVVVGGVLSFVVGLYMLSVSKIVAPSEGTGKIDPPPKNDFTPPPNVEAMHASPPPNVEPKGAKPQAGEPRDVILRLKGGDSRVELAKTVGLLDTRGEFTVEMWARVNNPEGTQRFFGDRVARFYGAAKPSVYGGWECGPQFFDRAWGRLWTNIAGADRDVGGAAGGGFNVTPVWHHVAYVNSGNQCFIYIDGRQTLQAGYQAPGPAPSPIDLSIGASPEGDKRIFDGDVRAFRATSKARYKQTFVPPKKFQKDAGTVILLDFSGAGTRIKDLAGNHDGKIVNADWVVGAPPDPDPIPTNSPLRDCGSREIASSSSPTPRDFSAARSSVSRPGSRHRRSRGRICTCSEIERAGACISVRAAEATRNGRRCFPSAGRPGSRTRTWRR